jgi:hypothetical protein
MCRLSSAPGPFKTTTAKHNSYLVWRLQTAQGNLTSSGGLMMARTVPNSFLHEVTLSKAERGSKRTHNNKNVEALNWFLPDNPNMQL